MYSRRIEFLLHSTVTSNVKVSLVSELKKQDVPKPIAISLFHHILNVGNTLFEGGRDFRPQTPLQHRSGFHVLKKRLACWEIWFSFFLPDSIQCIFTNVLINCYNNLVDILSGYDYGILKKHTDEELSYISG